MKKTSSDYKFRSLETVSSKSSYKVSFRAILLIIICTFILLLILPWQQTIRGSGKVTVFSPMDRPQEIFTQIDGKINTWHVVEGQRVKKGDILLEIDEVQTQFLDIRQIERLKSKKAALISKQEAIINSITALGEQIKSLSILPENIAKGQTSIIKQQKDNLIAANKSLETAKFNLNRIKNLYDDGLRSKRDLELAQLKTTTRKTELDIAKSEFDISIFSRTQKVAEINAKIQSVKSSKANAQEKHASVKAEIIKLDIDIANLETRKKQQIIKAPIDGQITRLQTLGRLETIKSGQSVAVIVPEVVDQAVELYVSDYNAPLMRKGRHVRLMFSGWPAVQFPGWPFLSVGTFGGTIAAVDAVDDGNNRFRVIIRPDQKRIANKQDEKWPEYPLLRPGTKAYGWILLDVVTIAFEIWRQFNGFPASFPEEESIKKNGFVKKKRK